MNQLISKLQVRLATIRNEDGQGLAEYALILALIAAVSIFALTSLGGARKNGLARI